MKARLHRLKTGTVEKLMFEIPREVQPAFQKLVEKVAPTGDWYDVEVKPPRRIRSTGYKSANHHINGHLMQIAAETGNSFDCLKLEAKRIAAERGQWIWETLKNGSIYPGSEADASVGEASALIEVIHQLAAEWGITLQED